MEFKMLTDLSVLPQKIEFNFEELKADLIPKLDYYKNLVVSEDGIKEAKADKANLNKLAKAIDDKRKEVRLRTISSNSVAVDGCGCQETSIVFSLSRNRKTTNII